MYFPLWYFSLYSFLLDCTSIWEKSWWPTHLNLCLFYNLFDFWTALEKYIEGKYKKMNNCLMITGFRLWRLFVPVQHIGHLSILQGVYGKVYFYNFAFIVSSLKKKKKKWMKIGREGEDLRKCNFKMSFYLKPQGRLVASHLCTEDLQHMWLFVQHHGLLSLTTHESVSQLVAWRQVYPPGQPQDDGLKHYLLIVATVRLQKLYVCNSVHLVRGLYK